MSTLKSSAEHLTLNADGSGNDIKFQSNATEVAAIDQAGNLTLSGTVDGVDIQTLNTTAGAALPKAGGTMTGDLDISDTGVGALTVGGTTNAYSAPVLFTVSDLGLDITDGTKHLASWATHGGSSHAGSAIGTRSNHDLALITNDTKRIIINSSGNVGIGVSDPDMKLEVNGQIKIDSSVSGDNIMAIINSASDGYGPYFKAGGGNTSQFLFKLLTHNNTEKFRVDGDGRVGIGAEAHNYYSSADNLVVYDSAEHAGITIASGGANKTGNIYFADGTSGVAEYEGYIEYNHSNNSMIFGTNHATRLSIDSTGAVTMPAQPAFHAGGNDGSVNGAGQVIKFDSERFDQNSDYSTSTGIFTAPVTGKYYLQTQVLVANVSNGQRFDLNCVTSNVTFTFGSPGRLEVQSGTTWNDSTKYIALGGNTIIEMDAGDTAKIQFGAFGGGGVYTGSSWTYFSGYLAC